jgi:hypothetical protein
MSLVPYPLALGRVAGGNHIKAAANDEREPLTPAGEQARREKMREEYSCGLDQTGPQWEREDEEPYDYPREGV